MTSEAIAEIEKLSKQIDDMASFGKDFADEFERSGIEGRLILLADLTGRLFATYLDVLAERLDKLKADAALSEEGR